MLVSEVFGPTIQGEGKSLGLPAMFLRVAGCPLSCSWCDTAYAWDWDRYRKAEHTRRITVEAAWAELRASAAGSRVRSLVITGGEPASQTVPLVWLAHQAKDFGWRVEVETSGSLSLGDLPAVVDLVTVSPKLVGSGVGENLRINLDVLKLLSKRDNVVWKFVIDSQTDLVEAIGLVKKLDVDQSDVYLMAQATHAAEVLERTQWLVEAAIEHGYRVSPRLHTLLWGNERGR